MELSEKALNEFEDIWKLDHPGKIISREEVLRMATKVVGVVELLYLENSRSLYE